MTDIYKYKAIVNNAIKHYFSDPYDKEDAWQEIALRLLRCDKDNDMYVAKVAHNVCRTMRKRDTHRRRVESQTLGIWNEADTKDPLHYAVEQEEEDILHSSIDDLSDALATTARMFYIDGMTYAEIADALDVNVSTVGVRLHRARSKNAATLSNNE